MEKEKYLYFDIEKVNKNITENIEAQVRSENFKPLRQRRINLSEYHNNIANKITEAIEKNKSKIEAEEKKQSIDIIKENISNDESINLFKIKYTVKEDFTKKYIMTIGATPYNTNTILELKYPGNIYLL